VRLAVEAAARGRAPGAAWARLRRQWPRIRASGLHASAEAVAEALIKRVKDELAPGAAATELILEFSPVMVAHTGPGLAGLAWWWQAPRDLG
jgi:fatty acid-binding protein DegV